MSGRASHVLVGFCNVAVGSPVLALVDLASWRVSVLDVPDRISDWGGIRGMALTPDHLIALTSRMQEPGSRPEAGEPQSGILFFDRTSLALVAERPLASVVEAHSLVISGGDALVVSTGTDELVRLRLEGTTVLSAETMWRPDPAGPLSDVHHLNGLCRCGTELLISGIGRKSGDTWSTARDGFVFNLTTGTRLARGIRHPHSVTDAGGTLAYCESATSTVHLMDGGRSEPMYGYVRGLCRVGERLLAGISAGRRKSASSGVTSRGEPGEPDGACALAVLDFPSLRIAHMVGLARSSFEIYDLLPVAGVERWPVVSEAVWMTKRVEGLAAGVERRDAEVARLHTEVGARDAVVARLHQEVAARDRTVARLHREVAIRDRAIQVT